MIFSPKTPFELTTIDTLTKLHTEEFVLIRLTSTMLTKSIIDASFLVRNLFKKGNIIDYETIKQGPEYKQERDAIFLSDDSYSLTASFYRPITKSGDPRFWIKGMKQLHKVKEKDLLFITIYNKTLHIIHINEKYLSIDLLKKTFENQLITNILKKLQPLLVSLNQQGFIPSVGKNKTAAKDVGETLEFALNILPNSNVKADFEDIIELKAKRKKAKTKDTLFSMVPDYSNTQSQINSSNEMIKTYGYNSKRYPEFIDLFITVNNKPNRQGLYLIVDEKKEEIQQWYTSTDSIPILTAVWSFIDIEYRLNQKHKATAWIIAEETKINDLYFFHYSEAVFSRKPLFASFIYLIQEGIITYDWRGRVKKDGSGYKDKGHCWRISPKNRDLLFGSIIEIDLN
ncbi:MvaI/BcnI family restriction endonuclease [Brochothrix thermosphacta]|uniref:MvaI/BcnI family restriction endonuclease n=1 Tax=Brochothrix thermosphacta TaxID=2756 RepID=UPI000D7B2516|nr:MvaI/BcnI family restriction endonuclease [Brochothrix thermosphacta]SPN74423.1 conserved hypothetical protein [Brochothrix thermosphacta]